MINSIDVNEEKRILGSGHPDGSVRLWDSRRMVLYHMNN